MERVSFLFPVKLAEAEVRSKVPGFSKPLLMAFGIRCVIQNTLLRHISGAA
jgi:hypothetical protein